MARIAFFLPNFGGGGAEHVALTVIDGLAAKGHQIDLLLCRKEGLLLDSLPESVRVIDLAASRFRQALPPLIRYLRRERPDALQASMWPLTAIAIVATRLARAGNRIVVSEHSALSRAYADRGPIHRLVLRQSIRATYPLSTHRIAVSHGVASDLAGLGLPTSLIEVVPNPIRSPRKDDKQPFLWPGPGRRILSVGNLGPAKNHDLLIRAFAKVSAEVEASLVICGEGERRSELTALIGQLGLRDRVFLLGYVRGTDAVYGAADVFVLSSDWEGYPLVLLEALQAGLPIVSTDCNHGPREVLDGGRFGTLVPVGNEATLAKAMIDTLNAAPDPQAQRLRAGELAGARSIDRYEALLLGMNGPAT